MEPMTTPTARFPFGVSLWSHRNTETRILIVLQGDAPSGRDRIDFLGFNEVRRRNLDRPIIPTSLELSNDEKILKDPNSHAVRVRDYHDQFDLVQPDFCMQ